MAATATVLVVGAGPTGLLAAAELQRRGVDCLLIDAHERPMDWDRATVVHPRSLEIFESLGIVEPLLAAGVKQRRARIHSGGSVLGEIDLSLCGSRYPFNIGISEEVTEGILTDYLQRQGGSVTRGTTLIGLEERADGVVATLAQGGDETRMFARFVIGCDGHHSAVRTLAGIGQDGHDIAEPWAVFDAAVPGWAEPLEANYAYLDEVPVILTALPDARWRVYLRPRTPEADLAEEALATLHRYLPAARFDAIARPTRFHCHTKVAQRFNDGHVLLAGDAAHTCSPAQGHGMNTGLQDAVNLAWKLALVCHGHCDAALLDSYHAERRPAAEVVMASGDAAETAQMLHGADARRERDAAIRAAFADPVARHHEAVAEAELDVDYAASPIVLGERHGPGRPGQRLPDGIDVTSATGGAGPLHRHTHRRGHTAFLIGGAAAAPQAVAALHHELAPLADGMIIETSLALAAAPDAGDLDGALAPQAAEDLGIDDITLLVVRADGHIGLRAEHDHAASLARYVALLRAGRA